MKPAIQHYEGQAARLEGRKMVVVFDGFQLLDLEYTGNPGWLYQLPVRRVRNVRIDYRLNAKGDKWLIQSLEVIDG